MHKRISSGIPLGKRPDGQIMHTWEHNIKVCSKEIGWEDVEWINGADVQSLT
jgi:hypothetical protein